MKINFIQGDATSPIGEGKKIICHICNDMGAWGAGFVLALSAKWSYPEDFYRARQGYSLGVVDVITVEPDIMVANMIAQHNTYPDTNGNPPIRYDALKTALATVNKIAVEQGATLHMPRIGCGLAGGKWENVQAVIEEVVTVDVIVYDFK